LSSLIIRHVKCADKKRRLLVVFSTIYTPHSHDS
jgi:hypothetical protein